MQARERLMIMRAGFRVEMLPMCPHGYVARLDSARALSPRLAAPAFCARRALRRLLVEEALPQGKEE